MKHFIVIILSFFLLFPIRAINRVGEWELYPTFRIPKQICEGNSKVFFLADYSLYSYGKEDREIRELSRLNLLSDNNISLIATDTAGNMLVIAYSNGNIDLINTKNESVRNLPYIKNATLTSSKNINNISFAGDDTYIATDFGIVVLNNAKREIKTTYTFNEKIYAASRHGDYIYCTREDTKVYRCHIDNVPYNIENWEVITSLNPIVDIIPTNKGLLLLHGNNDVYLYSAEGSISIFIGDKNIQKIGHTLDGFLFQTTDNRIKLYDKALQPTQEISFASTDYTPVDVSCINTQNLLWCIAENSVVALRYDDASALSAIDEVDCGNYQKVYNPFSLTIANGRVYVSPAGVGALNDNQQVDGYISILEDGKWSNIYPEDVPCHRKPNNTWGTTYNIVVDPDDKETFYVGTWIEGLYRFTDNAYDTAWNNTNSILGTNQNWSNKASGLAFDRDKNLYILNYSDNCGMYVMKRDGSWISLPYNELKNLRDLHQVLIPKHSDTKWVVCPKGNSFVFAFDTNGTDAIGDDRTRRFTTFTDQNGETIDGTIFYEIAEDRDGQLWLATNRGTAVITNPDNYMSSGFTCNRIKIARNDGTNLADYLLNDEIIQAIAVDGGNRKWFGTKSSGAYLTSADGQETIYHFTGENSPLPSDNIYDIAVHPETGEVFFATEGGLASFRAEATEPQTSYSDVYVFPNPVRPDYDGSITVTGLQENSLVKITDTAGNLIYQNYSTGGQLVWDGRTRNGDRLHSGVYLVFASVDNGSEGVVTKFVVVR